MDWLDGINVGLLNKTLDGLWARQRVVAENLANAETPGYKAKEVKFETYLASRLKYITDEESLLREIRNAPVTVTESEAESLRADGNNVDFETENITMARTQLAYLYALQGMSDHFNRLRIAVTGGK